jgi:hypothetical protein
MKKQVSLPVAISIIVVVLLIVGVLGMRVWRAPSTVADKTANRAMNPREGGGPTPEALRYRDEYNRTHPEAQGSR